MYRVWLKSPHTYDKGHYFGCLMHSPGTTFATWQDAHRVLQSFVGNGFVGYIEYVPCDIA